MINSNSGVLGIIFPNSYDELVPELVADRLMASIPFASRYRIIDFIISGMVNSGIDNIAIMVRKNYHSLMDHLGSGREWDLTRKNGGLTIFPPLAEKNDRLYVGRIEGLANILPFLRSQKEKYVVMADTNIAANFDYSDMLKAHIASGADCTVAYSEDTLFENTTRRMENAKELYYTYQLDGDRVTEVNVNSRQKGVQNVAMNIFIMERERLIDEINNAYVRGYMYFQRDILARNAETMNIRAYKFEGYMARITGMKSYFDENMKLLDDANVDALFGNNPVYTKIRDDNPTRYVEGAKASNVMVADGCVIEGEVENSILFRGVKVAKGAKVKNCILMQDTVIEKDAQVDYLITDKSVVVSEGKCMKGEPTFPLFIPKGHTV